MATINKPTTSKKISKKMSKKMFVLKSADGECFEIEEAAAIQSETIKNLIEDGCANNEIPLANVTSKILAKVVEYCKKHASNEETKEEIKKWDAEFVKIDQGTLFELMTAANYLNIKGLIDLTCQTVADMISGKTPEEIRKILNIENDFTPKEEEEMRKENQWAFE